MVKRLSDQFAHAEESTQVTAEERELQEFRAWKATNAPEIVVDDVLHVAQACRNCYGHSSEFRPLDWLKLRYIDGWLWRVQPARALCRQEDILGMSDQAIYELATS